MTMSMKGFSLIECLIYCAITSCMSILVFSFFNRTITGVHLFTLQQQEIMVQCTLQQLLRKDIQMASQQPCDWHTAESAMIFRVGSTCIGWQLDNKNLYRIKGKYDFSDHKWLKKSSALVAQGVDYFDSSFKKDHATILSASYVLGLRKFMMRRKIHLINGILG